MLFDPGLELFGSAAQHIAADRIELLVAAEEPDHSLGLLKRLDSPVEQDPVKAAVSEANAILVVLIKRVHPRLPCSEPVA